MDCAGQEEVSFRLKGPGEYKYFFTLADHNKTVSRPDVFTILSPYSDQIHKLELDLLDGLSKFDLNQLSQYFVSADKDESLGLSSTESLEFENLLNQQCRCLFSLLNTNHNAEVSYIELLASTQSKESLLALFDTFDSDKTETVT
mgnify:FL=1